MAQIQIQAPQEVQIATQEHIRVQAPEQYEKVFQDASYEERQTEMLLDLAEMASLDDSETEMVEGDEDADFDSEMSCEDEDAVDHDDPQASESVDASGEDVAEGGFASDVDAIYILRRADGTFRCIVEEELSKWANRHSRFSKYGKANSSGKDKGEPRRTVCYRAIADWLEKEFQDELSSPEMLLKKLKDKPRMAKKVFCEGKAFDDSQLSRALKDAIIIWSDYAIPMQVLFQQGKIR